MGGWVWVDYERGRRRRGVDEIMGYGLLIYGMDIWMEEKGFGSGNGSVCQ